MRKAALAKFLNLAENQLFTGESGVYSFTDLRMDYLVMTEEEANAAAKEQIWSFINTFDTDFLNTHLAHPLTEEKRAFLLKKGCECCQLVMAAFIPDYDRFAKEAIERYGREYFLCFEDKTEYRVEYKGTEYCVYRLV